MYLFFHVKLSPPPLFKPFPTFLPIFFTFNPMHITPSIHFSLNFPFQTPKFWTNSRPTSSPSRIFLLFSCSSQLRYVFFTYFFLVLVKVWHFWAICDEISSVNLFLLMIVAWLLLGVKILGLISWIRFILCMILIGANTWSKNWENFGILCSCA